MLKLSIIIPVYNVEPYLRACLDSVIVPELGGFEIIAVDDGSTDASPQILAEYATRCPQLLRTLRTENGGLGHARNEGITLARGEYLLFLDSDDSLREGALAQMLSLLDGSFDLMLFDFVSVDARGRALSRSFGCSREGSFTFSDYPELLFDPPNACNKLWRRSLFTETGVRFPDRLWFEDLATSPKLYLHCERIRYERQDWYRYLQRESSITNNRDPRRNLEMCTVIRSVMEHYRETGNYAQYREQLEYMAFYHELLTSSVRVNRIDPDSPVQDALLEDFLSQLPSFREKPYVRQMPAKYRLLTALILKKRRRLLHLMMTLNDLRYRGI